jgi:hypothetical protein
MKRENNKARILAWLSDGRRHHMSELLEVGGYRYSARIYELRKEGFDIETLQVGDDEFAYRLRAGQGELAL